MVCQVIVHGLLGENVFLDLCNTPEEMKKMTVLQLKQKIAQRLPESGGLENLQLTYTDKRLDKDYAVLSDYGIQHKSHIHLVVRVPGGLRA